MWYKAATFPTQDAARSVWRKLHNELLPLNIDLTSFSLIYRESWYVACVSERVPPLKAQAIVEKHFQTGTPASLPDDTVQGLLDRRLERTKYAKRTPGSPTLSYEGHSPTPIYTDTSTPMSQKDTDRHLDAVTHSLREQGYPFREIYKMYHARSIDTIMFRDLAIHQLDKSAYYLFTETARLMHRSVSTGAISWVSPGMDMWIEHDKAQPYGQTGYNVQAVYLYRKHPKDTIETAPLLTEEKETLAGITRMSEDIWEIVVLAENTRPLLMFIYDVKNDVAQIDPAHTCIYGLCEEVSIPDMGGRYHMTQMHECEQCRDMMLSFLAWIHTAIEQVQLKYAVTPEPEPFRTDVLAWTERRLMPRHHGKGKPKEKAVRLEIPFTIISYDVSLRPGRLFPDESEPEKETSEQRTSWLRLHGKEDIIYEKRYIGIYSRRYPTRKNGLRREGLVQVTHTEAKYIPLLRPEVRKGTIKRVTARKFQTS